MSKNSSTSGYSVWLPGSTTPSQSEPGSDANEEYSALPKAPASLEPHYRIV